jgi:two-component system, NtrC family, nitrogen regulation response regulator GlnG
MTDNATIVVADDDQAIRTVVRQALMRVGYDVRVTDTGAGLWQIIDQNIGDVVITDVVLPDEDGLDLLPRIRARRPDLPVIVMSAQNTLSTAVRATERGAFEYLPKPFDLNEMIKAVADALARARQTPSDKKPLESLLKDQPLLIGRSAAMQDVYRIMARVVPTDLTVMILGESGTGKELVARALHQLGARKSGPFIPVNMAAIPRELIESELFGHEKGAFTGAAARTAGKFEQAQGGTLFLDEIGDMPIDAQTRLLRVLQEGEFTTVGGRNAQRADVRVVAATNKDLRRLIDAGRFREDLYYRLNVVPLRLPALRQRPDDIADLAQHFLTEAAKLGLPQKTMDASAIEWMRKYEWPGNVRELENLMRRLAVLAREDSINAAVLELEMHDNRNPAPLAVLAGDGLADQVENHLARYFSTFGKDLPPDGLYDRILLEIERPLLLLTLTATGGNQIRAAKLLGLNRNTLRKKLNDLNIDASRVRRSN